MTTRQLASAVLASLVVAGCATVAPSGSTMSGRTGGRPASHDCRAGQACDVAVNVECPSDPMQACWITVQYDLVLLRVSQGARGLTWRLPPGRDYEFAGNGIVIDPSKFRCSANGPYIFVCDATTTDFAAHKYDVNVRHRSGTRQVAPLDPWVVTN